MDKPTIELKRITYNARLSEETSAYAADFYVNGVKWGQVSNTGRGGQDRVDLVAGRNYDDLVALNKLIAETYPTIDATDVGGDTLTPDLETVCGECLNEFLILRDVRRDLGRDVMFFKDGRPGDGQTKPLFKIGIGKHPAARVIAHVQTKYPTAFIINELPIAEAVKAYRQAE
jgi:hypothetical protein